MKYSSTVDKECSDFDNLKDQLSRVASKVASEAKFEYFVNRM